MKKLKMEIKKGFGIYIRNILSKALSLIDELLSEEF
jgi:hypothetical protein